MSDAAIAIPAPLAAPRQRVINPWIVAAAVVIPTFMEVLDTTIANVALRYIAGGLSAPVTDSEWVITSYLAANAIVLPISGWLALKLGRRNYFLLSIGIFTLASGLCGVATNLGMLIAARVLQGFAGGGLQPSSQGVLLDTFPPEKQGMAMTVFSVAALLAPVVGPCLGGFITDNYGWRWIFYLNLPVGIIALVFCRAVVFDPPFFKAEQEAVRKRGGRFDSPGLLLLGVTMVCWEVMLSKGQEWDWLGDPFLRIQTLLFLFLTCGGLLIWREMHIKNPLINFRTLSDRNFRTCCITIFCAYGVLYANTTSLPTLLQSLFGYDATTSGLVTSPAGIFAIFILLIIGRLLTRGVDARYLMALGLFVLGLGNYWFSILNLDISPWQIVWPRVVLIGGLSMLFAPLNVAAFLKIPKEMRGAAVGLLALLRNEGGSVGTSLAQTIQERREQFHLLRLNEYLDPLNPAVNGFLANAGPAYATQTSDPVAAKLMALQTLDDLRQQQASSLAYFDTFTAFAAVSFVLMFVVFTMHRSVAAKGAHVAAE
jgi:DHA2 family multidrug resistance protein